MAPPSVIRAARSRRTRALSLAHRAHLPEDLRFLLAAYPRRIWGDHANFGPTTRFYLDRHAMFREALAVLRRLSGEALDAPRPGAAFGRDFSRVGSFFLRELHGHHQIEDAHYFPALTRLEPRLIRGFDILEADHVAIHATLDRFAAEANAALMGLQSDDPKRALAVLAGGLKGMDRLLDRHLEDEEELVIPVMLDHGEAALGL